MKWTKDIPDKEGYYWYQGANWEFSPTVVRVCYHEGLPEHGLEPFWVAEGHDLEFDPYKGGYFDGERTAPDDPDAKWAGPIPEPEGDA